jgi:hypothetical protein
MSALETPRSELGSSLGLAPLQPLSAEEEAALDANPRERLYEMNALTAPSQLASTLGALTKLLLLQDRADENVADYAVEFFEQLKLARAADPRIDFDRFLAAQLKIMQKKSEASHSYDFEKPFAPPESLTHMLVAFSKEVIRFQPADLFGFALAYFTALSAGEDALDKFLAGQAKIAEEKQRVWDAEKKRAKKKKEKAAAARDAGED